MLLHEVDTVQDVFERCYMVMAHPRMLLPADNSEEIREK